MSNVGKNPQSSEMAGILPQHCLASPLSLTEQPESMKSECLLKSLATA